MKTSDIYKDMITVKIDRVYHDGGLDKVSLEDLREMYGMLLNELDQKDALIMQQANTIESQNIYVKHIKKQLDELNGIVLD